jgi:hypothetical protein
VTQRDKLIALIMGAKIGTVSLVNAEQIADHLIANNVFVLPCAIGSTVWIVSKNCTEPYPAKFKLDDISAIGKRIFLSKESAMRYMRREKSR